MGGSYDNMKKKTFFFLFLKKKKKEEKKTPFWFPEIRRDSNCLINYNLSQILRKKKSWSMNRLGF
jgi:hypothetical protein